MQLNKRSRIFLGILIAGILFLGYFIVTTIFFPSRPVGSGSTTATTTETPDPDLYPLKIKNDVAFDVTVSVYGRADKDRWVATLKPGHTGSWQLPAAWAATQTGLSAALLMGSMKISLSYTAAAGAVEREADPAKAVAWLAIRSPRTHSWRINVSDLM